MKICRRGLMAIALVLFVIIVSGCLLRASDGDKELLADQEETFALFHDCLPEEVTQVDISYCQNTEETKWLLQKKEIKQWVTWLGELRLHHTTFEEGKSPKDSQEGKSYYFTINAGEVTFSYVYAGKKFYVFFDKEWYEVANPTEFPSNLETIVDEISLAKFVR